MEKIMVYWSANGKSRLIIGFVLLCAGCNVSTNPADIYHKPSGDNEERVTSQERNEQRKEALKKAGARATADEQGRITEIYFGGKATDENLPLLKGLENLKRLDLETAKISSGALVNLEGLTNLEYLSLYETQITDAALVHLRGLTNLRELFLHGNSITDAGLENLKGLTDLKTLNISSTLWVHDRMQIGDAGMEHVKALKNLRNLNLKRTNVTARGLEQLTVLSELEHLSLGGTKIDDSGMVELAKIKSLKRLKLAFTVVTDAGMEHLKDMSRLELLNLASDHVTDSGLVHLESLKQLKYLEVRGYRFSDTALAYITKLPRLERLGLRDRVGDRMAVPYIRPDRPTSAQYTAAGLALLKDIKTLRVLWFTHAYVGDAEFEQFAKMKGLEELTLFKPVLRVGKGDLQSRAIEVQRRLQEALPSTKVAVSGFEFITGRLK